MNVSVAWRILRNATITTSRLYLSVIFLIYGAVKLYPGQFISGGAPYDPGKTRSDVSGMGVFRVFSLV